jgi:hypothetical protein
VTSSFVELVVAVENLEGHWRNDDVRTALLPVEELKTMLLDLITAVQQGRPPRGRQFPARSRPV